VLLDGVDDVLDDDWSEVLLGGVDGVLLDDDGVLLLEPDDGMLLVLGDGLDELLDDDWSEALEGIDEAPLPFRAARVCWSSWPVEARLFCCWNCLIAASVFGPILPSTVRSMPLAFSACCASRTSELPLDWVEEDADCDDADCDEFDCAALFEACEALLSLARTAVLESASAAMTACASFMCIPFRYRRNGQQGCAPSRALIARGRTQAAR
jgi:hypothetical protein